MFSTAIVDTHDLFLFDQITSPSCQGGILPTFLATVDNTGNCATVQLKIDGNGNTWIIGNLSTNVGILVSSCPASVIFRFTFLDGGFICNVTL